MAVVDTLGNTTTVRTLEGSVWGGRAELVEIASIGSAEGEDPYLFGDVRGIAADSERIYVLDWQIFAVRVYDHQGVYLRDIGRQGQGPGEFRDPIAIGVHDEGDRLFVRDKVGGIVHIFSEQGDFIDSYRSSVIGSFYGMTKMMRVSEEGDPYLLGTHYIPVPGSANGFSSKYVMVGILPTGAPFDTLDVPWYNFRILQIPGSGYQPTISVPFSPDKNWNMTHSRAMVGGVSDEYSFEVRFHNGRILRIERETPTIPVMPEEARWYARALTERMKRTDPTWVWRGPSIPDSKPAFESFHPDWSDRIWVLREGPGALSGDNGAWTSTYLLDVFEERTGRYLGEVQVPEGMRFVPEPYIRDDLFIAHFEDEEGVPYVKCYRIEPPN